MEKNEVSSHEVLVYRELAKGEWITSNAIAEATGVAPRTARAHALKLVRLGIVDQAEVFPGHRYRWSAYEKQDAAYLQRLVNAAEALGVEF